MIEDKPLQGIEEIPLQITEGSLGFALPFEFFHRGPAQVLGLKQ